MYLRWDEQTIVDFSEENINRMYNRGFLFTREGKGKMYQTRSVRIDLRKFELSSENRRVLTKTEGLRLTALDLPFTGYDWRIGKLAKDFYETKFDKRVFSANKVRELLTSEHNFNLLFSYVLSPLKRGSQVGNRNGYCICYSNKEILHFSYPFYTISNILNIQYPNLGLGMMIRAIIYAKEAGKRYVYLGSAKDAKAKYKLQFAGLEWFDGEEWKTDVRELKEILKNQ